MAGITQQTRLPSVEPLFILSREILGQDQYRPRPYDICIAASDIIGRENVLGAQNIRGIWRLYLKSREKRLDLLMKGMSLRGRSVTLYEKNPKATNNEDPNQKVEKVTIRMLPLSVSNEEVKTYLQSKGVDLTTEVRIGKERDDNGELTSFINGDRYAYAKSPLKSPLPRTVHIADQQCACYHSSQQNTCLVCNSIGHKTRDPTCPAFTSAQDIVTVVSYQHPLSNMHMGAKLVYQGDEYRSVEHAYQALKAKEAGRPELQQQICDAKHAGIAKQLSHQLPDLPTWAEKRAEVMEDLLTARALADPLFREALLETGDQPIAHTVRDTLWGTGLGPALTKVTLSTYWPGKNLMGHLLEVLRENIRSAPLSYSTPDDTSLQQQQQPTENLQHTLEEPIPSSTAQKVTKVQCDPATVTSTPDPSEAHRHVKKRGRLPDRSLGRREPSPSPSSPCTRGHRSKSTGLGTPQATTIDAYLKRKPSGTPEDKPQYKQSKQNSDDEESDNG